ncbi:hypothetical protein HU200_066349 [Digitaria exilis]|uniref:F-box domain-containing protein n=1 Tax=Digitaria exilis TaxID=1010633 RepID=A0A835DSY0_9POAL|nr:hypothetical protein HU200_066349 [Digitaria exilis]
MHDESPAREHADWTACSRFSRDIKTCSHRVGLTCQSDPRTPQDSRCHSVCRSRSSLTYPHQTLGAPSSAAATHPTPPPPASISTTMAPPPEMTTPTTTITMLPEEMIEEVLVRVAPEDPATLARAAMANKKWCRLITGKPFRAKYLAHHRRCSSPMLSFLCDVREGDFRHYGLKFTARHVKSPSSSFRPQLASDHIGDDLRPHDACHGRVLLRGTQDRWTSFDLLVWDPITRKRTKIPRPPCYAVTWKAAVFCAAPGAIAEMAAPPRATTVVYITDHRMGILTCVYSSVTREWGEPSFHGGLGGFLGRERAAFVNEALHFMLDNQNKILKLDVKTWETSVIHLPYLRYNRWLHRTLPIELIAMEDNKKLGFAVMEISRLCVWSMPPWTRARKLAVELARDSAPTRPLLGAVVVHASKKMGAARREGRMTPSARFGGTGSSCI